MTRGKPPKTLHCSRCNYVTHSGISAMRKHYYAKHPAIMKRHKSRGKASKKSNVSRETLIKRLIAALK